MSKFKLGDRVRVYTSYSVFKGTVGKKSSGAVLKEAIKVIPDNPLKARVDPDGFVEDHCYVHPKQCRKLKK